MTFSAFFLPFGWITETSQMKRTFILLTALLGMLTGCNNATAPDPDLEYATELLKPGTAVPDFELKDLNGRPVRLDEFRGKTVILEFWASWCPDCRADLPLVKAMQQAADPEKVAFVSVSFDRTFEALEAFAAENGLSGVQLFEPAGKKDSAIAADYGVKWIPSYYVIDPDGKVAFATVVAKKVATLLQGKNPGKVKARLGNLCSDESCLLDFQ